MNEEQLKRISKTGNEVISTINKISVEMHESLKTILQPIQEMANTLRKTMATEFMKSFSLALGSFITDVQKAKENPNSYFNYIKYQKDLDKMHWAWPYQIEASELKMLLETATNEKEFDTVMIGFFDKEKANKICADICDNLSSHHRMMLKQAKRAYDRGDYAIANNALMTIIDNLLSKYLVNKGKTNRWGILKPILDYYDNFPLNEVEFIFELCMLSNNIDFLFQDYKFNEKIDIKTNKKVRRHPSLHGVKYSNRKVDSLLLFNTLYNLIVLSSVLHDFKNCLEYKNKKFIFSDKKKKELDEAKYKEAILLIIELKKKANHKEIFQSMKEIFPETMENQGKYLSRILQKMKITDRSIKCEKLNGKNYWILNRLTDEDD